MWGKVNRSFGGSTDMGALSAAERGMSFGPWRMDTKNLKCTMQKMVWRLGILAMLAAGPAAATENVPDLRMEPALHPGDVLTGEVLRDGEWVYGQPPLLAPGWFRWGATNRCTLQFDVMAWLGGLPDANVRWLVGASADGRFRLSWETMALYFNAHRDNLRDLADDDDHLFIQRSGLGGYTRLNADIAIGQKWIGRVSAGVSYSRRLEIRNEDRADSRGKRFRSLWDPAVTFGWEYRPGPAWAFHGGIGYGETFTFQENRPRKVQGSYGFRMAPLRKHRNPFWRNMRLEVDAIVTYFPDARELRSIPIPIVPYAYWQW